MKNLQKGFIVPTLLVIIALLVIGGGSYIYLKNTKDQPLPVKPMNEDTRSDLDNKINLDSTSREFVGTWITAGNDFMYAELNLFETGEFKEKSYFVSNEKNIFNGTGSWKLTDKDNNKYLLLTYNQSIQSPKDEQMIEQYKGWGQEFIGNNQILLKITTDQYRTYFRYQGNLMLKS